MPPCTVAYTASAADKVLRGRVPGVVQGLGWVRGSVAVKHPRRMACTAPAAAARLAAIAAMRGQGNMMNRGCMRFTAGFAERGLPLQHACTPGCATSAARPASMPLPAGVRAARHETQMI